MAVPQGRLDRDFGDALTALVGEQAAGLRDNTVVGRKEQWSAEYKQRGRRGVAGGQYVYIWANGTHVNVRLEDDANNRQGILVVMGATV